LADLLLPSPERLRFDEAKRMLGNYRRMIETQLAQLPRDLSPEEVAALGGGLEKDPKIRDAILSIYRTHRKAEVETAFPQVARRSFVVVVVAAIEEHAHVLCDALHASKVLPLRWSDLHGNTLERLETYAVKLAGLAAPPAELWERAESLQEIRNCIVHTNGDVSRTRDSGKSLRAIAAGKKFEGYDIDAKGQVVLQKEAGDLALSVFALLFTILYAEAKLPRHLAAFVALLGRPRQKKTPGSVHRVGRLWFGGNVAYASRASFVTPSRRSASATIA
jgi:hypothetical protein